jgi:hypothetical protein
LGKLRGSGIAGIALAVLWGCTPMPEAEEPLTTDEVVASLQVQVERAEVGLVLHLTNLTAGPVVLEFTSGQRYDFEVWQGGRLLWRWSEGQMFTQALGSEQLGPGESRSYGASWRPEGRTGSFEAVGRVTASNRSIEQRSEFLVP